MQALFVIAFVGVDNERFQNFPMPPLHPQLWLVWALRSEEYPHVKPFFRAKVWSLALPKSRKTCKQTGVGCSTLYVIVEHSTVHFQGSPYSMWGESIVQ